MGLDARVKRHRHRDVYVPLVPTLITIAFGAPVAVYVAQHVNPSAGLVLWPFLIISATVFALGLYLLAALICGLPLPGGFMGPEADKISSDDPDEEVGRECLVLAQAMWDLLALSQRDAPGYATEEPYSPTNIDEYRAAWRRAATASRVHENKVLSQFRERFGVRLSGVVHELMERGHMTEVEERHLYFKSDSIHWLDEVPRFLAAKGRELGARP